MDRRTFLKTTGTMALGAGLTKPGGALPAAPGLAGGRMVLPLNRGWRYRPSASADAHQPGIDASGFQKVTLPHANVALPWHGFDERQFEVVSVYRRSLQVPPSAAGKRVFVDFEGVMLASTVYLNGQLLGRYRGGFTPFSFELTGHLSLGGENLLSVEVDSRERADIPPFGNEVDYLTFGGIYREVALRIVPQLFIENIRAQAKDVLGDPLLEVTCYLDRSATARPGALTMQVELRDGQHVIAQKTGPVQVPAVKQHHWADADQALGALPYDAATDGPAGTLTLAGLRGKVALWELDRPQLYTVHVRLLEDGSVIDEDQRRIGFREATFTDHGFSLNGKIVKLHGLDRHQTFPWVGPAMPARVQRQDAKILRRDMQCNIVRTSHYPQSRHFLDACDEQGLLVLEEIPGWQHIGDQAWQDVSVDNVRRMIRRDWNHPSIVLWGVRINESPDNHDFYTRTNALAHALDPGRQTGGIRNMFDSELLEDVFTMNDFDWPLHPPNHPRYLNTEFVGHTFPTKTIDDKQRLQEHLVRHARVHNMLASSPQYAGGIGWCAFDYTTHANFGSGDRICYHGVMDIFRTPKPAAYFYKSMCDPAEQIVLEPAFHWARNDESVGFTTGMIASNCDHVKLFIRRNGEWQPLAEADSDRAQFAHLQCPPFSVPLGEQLRDWGDLRIDGYLNGKQVASRTMSGSGIDHAFRLVPDDTELMADGADATRVVLRVEDEFGNIRPFAADGIRFELSGPATLIGDNPFGLIGGTGAVWVRAGETPGVVTLAATHPRLGVQQLTIRTVSAPQA